MIGMAKQQGTNVYVYSETGSFMFNKTGNLVGYTSNTVTVKQGGTTYVYGEHGEIKFTTASTNIQNINRRGFLTNLFMSSSRAAFEKIMPSCFSTP